MCHSIIPFEERVEELRDEEPSIKDKADSNVARASKKRSGFGCD